MGTSAELALEMGVPGDFNRCMRFLTDLESEGGVK